MLLATPPGWLETQRIAAAWARLPALPCSVTSYARRVPKHTQACPEGTRAPPHGHDTSVAPEEGWQGKLFARRKLTAEQGCD